MRYNTPVTDNEYVLGEHQYLISQTDLDSHIIFANPAFIEASGYEWDELVGAPHNLIRHPDMPPEAFANFWDTIRAGKTWTGILKNRRKNGDFYWVHATAMPIVQNGQTVGYASVRRGVTAEEKVLASRVYARLRAGNKPGAHLANGVIRDHSLRGRLARLGSISLRFRLGLMTAFGVLGIVATALLGSYAAHDLYTLAASQPPASAATSPATASLPYQTEASAVYERLKLTLGLTAGFFSLLLLGWGLVLNRRVIQPLTSALTLSRQIAAGNLTAEIETRKNDEIGRLMSSLNVMRYSLVNIVQDVKQGIDVVTPATVDIAQGNKNLAQRTSAQAAALEQTSSSMEQLTATVAQGADSARSASELAEQASITATRGGKQIGNVVETMQQISESSAQINTIVSVIDDIAFQTNLLALNASVEAARAGEHGRGFAVVANEVRALAERSAHSARQITALIQSSSQRVEDGVVEVNQTREIMNDVVSAIQQVSQFMQQISLAAGEQRTGIEQVGEAVTSMDKMTQENAALVDKSAASAQALSAQSKGLERSISIFRIRDEKLAVSKLQRPHPIDTRSPVRHQFASP